MTQRWLWLLFPLGAATCSNPIHIPQNEGEVVAVVGEYKLFKDDVDIALAGSFTSDDSAIIYSEYIRKWVRNQSLFEKANRTLPDTAKNKKKLLEQYYHDLLVYELQTMLIQERLDTNVPMEAIQAYYDNNIRNFELKENIVRLHFMKFPDNISELEDYWKIFRNDDYIELDDLREICLEEGGYVMRDDTTWLYFNDILKEIPITTYSQETFLNNTKFIRLVDRGWVYFVNIRDFKVKNSASPFDFEAPRIRDIIINKRKVELMQQIEDEIVQEAYDKQLIQIN